MTLRMQYMIPYTNLEIDGMRVFGVIYCACKSGKPISTRLSTNLQIKYSKCIALYFYILIGVSDNFYMCY